MATVKKSKKRIIVPIAIVLVIAIIVTSIFIVRKVNGCTPSLPGIFTRRSALPAM